MTISYIRQIKMSDGEREEKEKLPSIETADKANGEEST